MSKFLILMYGVFAYGASLCTMVYMIGFVNGVIVPKNIDNGMAQSLFDAVCNDFGFVLLFGATHSMMARPAFKEKLAKIIPPAAERSTFVLVTSISLALLFWFWQPIDTVVWSSKGNWLISAASMVGWIIAFWSTFLIDHFDLFGLRQVWSYYRGIEYSAPPFVVRGLYKHSRHPLMLGFLIGFWFTPTMTVGHLLFAIAMTAYIAVGIFFEERDLAKCLGDDYAAYKEQTPMLMPSIWSKR